MHPVTMDRIEGRRLKEEGQQVALDFSGEWKEIVVDEFKKYAAQAKALGFNTTTIEAFRADMASRCLPMPTSNKAWGALPAILCKAQLIEPDWVVPGVQRRVKAVARATHAHEVKVWLLL